MLYGKAYTYIISSHRVRHLSNWLAFITINFSLESWSYIFQRIKLSQLIENSFNKLSNQKLNIQISSGVTQSNVRGKVGDISLCSNTGSFSI